MLGSFRAARSATGGARPIVLYGRMFDFSALRVVVFMVLDNNTNNRAACTRNFVDIQGFLKSLRLMELYKRKLLL